MVETPPSHSLHFLFHLPPLWTCTILPFLAAHLPQERIGNAAGTVVVILHLATKVPSIRGFDALLQAPNMSLVTTDCNLQLALTELLSYFWSPLCWMNTHSQSSPVFHFWLLITLLMSGFELMGSQVPLKWSYIIRLEVIIAFPAMIVQA